MIPRPGVADRGTGSIRFPFRTGIRTGQIPHSSFDCTPDRNFFVCDENNRCGAEGRLMPGLYRVCSVVGQSAKR